MRRTELIRVDKEFARVLRTLAADQKKFVTDITRELAFDLSLKSQKKKKRNQKGGPPFLDGPLF